MRANVLAAVLVASLLISPLALADGGHDHGATYDPTKPTLKYYFTTAGNTTNTAPTGTNATKVPVPASGLVTFKFAAARNLVLSSADVQLYAENTGLLPLTGLPNQMAFTVNLSHKGAFVKNWTASANPADPAVMQPNTPYSMKLALKGANLTLAKGDEVTVNVKLNWAQAQAGQIVLHTSSSARPSGLTGAALVAVADLGVSHDSAATFGWPASAMPANTGDVVAVDLMTEPGAGFLPVTKAVTLSTIGMADLALRLVDMSDATAGATHEDGTGGLKDPVVISMMVDGRDVRENLYPGEWVIRKVTVTLAGVYTVKCVSGCPTPGTIATLTVKAPTPPTGTTNPTGSTNPTQTTPTPTPETGGKGILGLPGFEVAAVAVALVAAAYVARRR